MKRINSMLVLFLLSSIAAANERVQINMSDAVEAGHVVVKPSREYQINFAGYEVPKEAELICFHVLASPTSHYYYQEIKPGKSVYAMTSDALKATTGSPAFSGLKSGDSAFLIIGSETQPGSINMGVLFSNESISIIVRE